MEIKKAVCSDLYYIAEFLHNAWHAEYRQIITDNYLDSMTVEARYKFLLKRFNDKAWDFSILIMDEKWIGVAVYGKSFTVGYPEDGEISAIYLNSDFIGKGYGHLLFTNVERELSIKGYDHFILDVLTDNTRAIKFYLAHGYEMVDNRIIKLGEKEYPLTVMRK